MLRSKDTPRRGLLAFGVIGVALIADVFVVVLPAQRDAEAFTTSSFTLLGGYRASYTRPVVQIAPEATPPRLLYGDEAKRARERGEQIWAATIEWPFPRQWGLFTPFYRSCRFHFAGWDAQTDQLRGDFVAAFNADPAFAALPRWCRESTASRTGRAHRIAWGYFAHDTLFLVGFVSFGIVGFRQARTMVRAARARRRPGSCPSCGYDLTGLRGNSCPECGEEATSKKAAAAPERGRGRRGT